MPAFLIVALLGALGYGAYYLYEHNISTPASTLSSDVRNALDAVIRGYPGVLPSPLGANATAEQWTHYAKWAMQGDTASLSPRGSFGLFLLSPKTLNDLGYMQGSSWAGGLSVDTFLNDQALQYEAFVKQSVNNANAIIGRYRGKLGTPLATSSPMKPQGTSVLSQTQDNTVTFPLPNLTQEQVDALKKLESASKQQTPWTDDTTGQVLKSYVDPVTGRKSILVPSKQPSGVAGDIGDVLSPPPGIDALGIGEADKVIASSITAYQKAHNGQNPPISSPSGFAGFLQSINPSNVAAALAVVAPYIPGGAGYAGAIMAGIAAKMDAGSADKWPLTEAALAAGTPAVAGPAGLTLSGLMAIAKQAGLTGLDKWMSDPTAAGKYPFTTKAFTECNGMF